MHAHACTLYKDSTTEYLLYSVQSIVWPWCVRPQVDRFGEGPFWTVYRGSCSSMTRMLACRVIAIVARDWRCTEFISFRFDFYRPQLLHFKHYLNQGPRQTPKHSSLLLSGGLLVLYYFLRSAGMCANPISEPSTALHL